MKIIIAGAGEVGTHLAKMLSRQNHDIVLIDDNEEKLQQLESNYDLISVTGSGTSINDLKESGISSADLFIAVTPFECQNITACVLAKNLGVKKTLARINNYEYLLPENKNFFEKLGVNALVYPEMLAAEEIADYVRINWVRQWMDFQNEALILTAIKVRGNAPIVNQKLMYLPDSSNYRIVAIRRGADTIIPTGNDEVLPNDIAYFITTKEYVSHVREQAGKEVINTKDLMIIGGSRIAVKTVKNLPDNISVKLIEKDRSRTTKLVEQLDDTMVILGDASNIELLKKEGIESMDVFVALTGSSETNILACTAAKRFGIKNTIAEVENIDYIQLAESLDIGAIINKKLLAADYIYQYTLDVDVCKVKNLTYVNADVVELTAREGSKITKDKIKNLRLPKDFFIGGIIRNGKGCIVNGDTIILPDDDVVIFCLSSSIHKIAKLFS
ncbi:MAG: Trk system potassium transporter TrkA [Prevotellaceae bacterium]|jgi:trk system potassium uptake protein TrkA|nr:Trk system potassium transporter TrkA [Prevotellaceae bacterium]